MEGQIAGIYQAENVEKDPSWNYSLWGIESYRVNEK